MKYFMILISVLALVMGLNAFANINAVVTATPNPAVINQPVAVNVAIQNTSAAQVNLSYLQITANYQGNLMSRIPWASSVINLNGPNSPVITISAGATVTVPVNAVFFAPSTGVTGSGTGKYFIGAAVGVSDGSVTGSAAAGQITVNPFTYPASQQ